VESITEQHAKALTTYAEEYRTAGFDVFVEPDDSILPVFLRGFRPDLIAMSRGKNYVLELKIGERSGQQQKWSAMAAAIDAQPEWHFRLIILNREGTLLVDAENISRETILRRMARVNQLIVAGQQEAALLVAWSNFEAAARHRLLTSEGVLPRPAFPQSIIKYLVHMGIISQDDMKRANEVMQIRNAVAHGFESPINTYDIESINQLTRQLLTTQE